MRKETQPIASTTCQDCSTLIRHSRLRSACIVKMLRTSSIAQIHAGWGGGKREGGQRCICRCRLHKEAALRTFGHDCDGADGRSRQPACQLLHAYHIGSKNAPLAPRAFLVRRGQVATAAEFLDSACHVGIMLIMRNLQERAKTVK